jgi:protein-S-isoprenylcysteine O-methyltransferase Ste14
MKDLAVNVLRAIVQWSTLLLSIIFRNQFATGAIGRSIGGILIVLGFALWVLSRMALGQAFTSSLSPKGFVTEGIYSKLRHPMYAGGVLLYVGVGILFQSSVGLVLTGLLVLPLLVYSAIEEERRMLEKFGEEYIDYRKNTIV